MIHGDKLKAAREAAGLSQTALAQRIGAAQQLIGQLERGTVKTSKLIYRIADVLGVAAHELDDEVPPGTSQRMIQVVGYVGAGAQVFAIDDHAKGDGLEEVMCPWGALGPSAVAVRVRGDSMVPAYYDGDLLFYDETHTDFTHLLGRDCVVALADGRRFIKEIRRTQNGQWYLHSHNAEPIVGVEIAWAAKVRLIQPRH